MNPANPCPKCGSRDIITDAKPLGGTDYTTLLIATFRKPGAAFFKGQQSTNISARICADCGYLELYADHPERLRVDS
ncbi:MAG: hypothetical protein V4689_10685 [Verrucomicrobiota bacterium]